MPADEDLTERRAEPLTKPRRYHSWSSCRFPGDWRWVTDCL